MEDLDTQRCVAGSEQSIIEDLQWLGLDWDGEVVRQSDRVHLYDRALETLRAGGHLYPCTCSRKELAEVASAPHANLNPGNSAEGERGPYPGTCRDRFPDREAATRATGRAASWRFRVQPGGCGFRDHIWGRYQEDVSETVGDFPISSKDGGAAYQLAVVVDDADQGIDHVLRGDDLLSSTVRQIHLQRALGLPSPAWFHVPMVVDPKGTRLAKRHDSLSLIELRKAGWAAPDVVAWVAQSAGLKGGPRSTAYDWVEGFCAENLPAGTVTCP